MLAAAIQAAPAGAVAPPALPGCVPSAPQSAAAPAAGAIPNPGTLESTITVSGVEDAIVDIDVTTTVAHPTSSDLDVTLVAPSGREVTLTTDNAAFLDNVYRGTRWDDQADPGSPVPYPILSQPRIVTDYPNYANNVTVPTLTPEEPLAALNGEDPNGTWTLRVTDDAPGAAGTLEGWSLSVVAQAREPVVTRTTHTLPFLGIITPDNSTNPFPLAVSGTSGRIWDVDVQPDTSGGDDVDLALGSPAGTIATLTTDNGAGSVTPPFEGVVFDAGADPATTPARRVVDATYGATFHSSLTAEEGGQFIGEEANGTWTLILHDDTNNGSGQLFRNYALSIASGACPPADLSSSMSATPATVTAGGVAVFTVALANAGPGAAAAVNLSDALPAGATLLSAAPSQGSCNGTACSLGSIQPHDSAQVVFVVRLDGVGAATNGASASSPTADPDGANNSSSATVQVGAPPAAPGGPAGGGDADAAPGVVIVGGSGQKLRTALRKGVGALTACTEACTVSVTLSVDAATRRRYKLGNARIGTATKRLTKAGAGSLKIKVPRATQRKLARARSLKLTFDATATDSAGQTGAHSAKLTLKR